MKRMNYFCNTKLHVKIFCIKPLSFAYLQQEKLFGRKRTIHVSHRSQNIENTWAFLSFKVDMTFTLNDTDLQITLTFK